MPLYVDENGTYGASSIVFLHGVGASGWMWWQQVGALSDFHCLTVDLPGHGKSNHVAWVSLSDTARQIAAIIEERATNGKASVVGLSLGAYVTLLLLKDHSKLVQRAILSGVTSAPMPNRFLLKPQLMLMALMRMRWIANMQAKALNLPPQAQLAFTENLQAMSMRTYRDIFEEAVDFTVPAALQHVTVPTLVTAGGDESKIIVQAVDVIARLMPSGQGRLAPGLEHGWNVEAPELFNAMVRAWICDTSLPAPLKPTS